MIHKAYEIGIKPAAKLFNTTPKFVSGRRDLSANRQV